MATQAVRKRILCIDNNASRNLAIYLLERIGFEVRTASSIADGIELARAQRFAIYLVNQQLVDGPDVASCSQLHESAPAAPILFYSTVLYPYQPIPDIHCRLHDHMLKPVSVCDVDRCTSRLIEERMKPVELIEHSRKASA